MKKTIILTLGLTFLLLWSACDTSKKPYKSPKSIAKAFAEYNLFDMQTSRMEYEANLFAAEISLPDDELLDCIYQGMDVSRIAKTMYSDINLVALKASDMIRRGYNFNHVDHQNDFLK